MKKVFLWLLCIMFFQQAQAQILKGLVKAQSGEVLPGANIIILETGKGTATDINGTFSFPAEEILNQEIIASFIGYMNDTLLVKNEGDLTIVMVEGLELDEVSIRGTATFVDPLDPMFKETLTKSELLKAPCCNLSESFETNASVDVSFTDAVSGAKQIKMLGLEGKYVQILRENIPNVRGLMNTNGLDYIPGTWVQSIDVGKGAGSVINGYESMTGQINVELLKPERDIPFFLNAYLNSFGRAELNVHTAQKLSEKLSTGIYAHGNLFASEIDQNNDAFMDLPKRKQFNLLNRWKYQGKASESQFGFQVLADDKLGGQVGYKKDMDHNTSSLYGLGIQTKRFELFGKTGILFPKTPHRGIGIIYSASYYDQQSYYGRTSYNGTEKSLYGNFIYQTMITDTRHKISAGTSFLLDDYSESYNDSAFARKEVVPGAFVEYSGLYSEKFALVAGVRYDYHNLYGSFITPRLHFKYSFNPDNTLRLSAGRGFRTPNIFAENTRVFASSREVVVEEEPKPEISWNAGASLQKKIHVGEKHVNLILDYYFTDFKQQMIMDLDTDVTKVYFYNLDGRSFAHSFQAEISFEPTERMDLKAAYKYYNVKSTINTDLMQNAFISKDRFFINGGYATKYDIWKFDLTYQWYGPKRLPDTSQNPSDLQLASFSPGFGTVNAQVTKAFRKWELYVGGENLTNFRQDPVIIDAENPFGDHFDASMVWGPVTGIMVYSGIRFSIE